MKAIVVGAGLAGLTAAYKLKQAGWEVKVLEAASYAGGRSATVFENGYTVDTAATQLSSGYTQYLALCKEIGLDKDLVDSSQIVGIARDGRVVEIDGGNIFSGALSPIVSLYSKAMLGRTLIDKMMLQPRLDFLNISDCHAYDDASFYDYGHSRMNAEAYDYLAAPLLRGNFLRNPDNASRLEWFAITDNFAGKKMLSIHGGITHLPTTLAGMLDVHLNAPVEHVEEVADGVEVVWQEGGVTQRDKADAVVMATRLVESMKICPAYAEIAAPVAGKLRYSRALMAHLGFRVPTRSKVIGVFLPQSETKEIALVWVEHNKNPECAPPGHGLITCYFDDACVDDCYNMADGKVLDIARSYLERLFPELEGQCDYSKVSRWPNGIPYPAPGAYRAIHELKQRIAPDARIQHAGDYFTCTGQNSAIYYGKRAAEKLIAHHEAKERAAQPG